MWELESSIGKNRSKYEKTIQLISLIKNQLKEAKDLNEFVQKGKVWMDTLHEKDDNVPLYEDLFDLNALSFDQLFTLIIGYYNQWVMRVYLEQDVTILFWHFRGHECKWNFNWNSCSCQTDRLEVEYGTGKYDIQEYFEKHGGFLDDIKVGDGINEHDFHFIGYFPDSDSHNHKASAYLREHCEAFDYECDCPRCVDDY